MQDIRITLGTGSTPYVMQTGEELLVTIQQLPGGAVQTITPNPTTNPFMIPNQDENACYLVGVNKRCVDGSLGGVQTIQVGACEGGGNVCIAYNLQNNTLEPLYYGYQQCDGTFINTETLPAGTGAVICAREGSLSTDSGITVTSNGLC